MKIMLNTFHVTLRRNNTMLLYNFNAGPSRRPSSDIKSSCVNIKNASPSIL